MVCIPRPCCTRVQVPGSRYYFSMIRNALHDQRILDFHPLPKIVDCSRAVKHAKALCLNYNVSTTKHMDFSSVEANLYPKVTNLFWYQIEMTTISVQIQNVYAAWAAFIVSSGKPRTTHPTSSPVAMELFQLKTIPINFIMLLKVLTPCNLLSERRS